MSAHETAVAGVLVDTYTATLGTDMFTGPVRPAQQPGIPALCLFVTQLGGARAPSHTLSGGAELSFVEIQIRVRSAADDYAGGQAFADAAYLAAHNAALTGYVSCHSQYSEPMYIGQVEQGCHGWSIVVELTKRREYGG